VPRPSRGSVPWASSAPLPVTRTSTNGQTGCNTVRLIVQLERLRVTRMARQPLLHDLVVQLRAPSQVWCGSDGEIRPTGVQGIFHGDVRVLSAVELRVGGAEPETIAVGERDDGLRVSQLARNLDGAGADPVTRVERHRSLERSEEHTSELQSRENLVCRLLLEKKKK